MLVHRLARRILAIGAGFVLLLSVPPAAGAADVTVTIYPTVALVSQLDMGLTHTARTIADSHDASAWARATTVMGASVTYHNRHIMGWGVDNPEPAPGTFNFSSLDARIAQIRAIPGAMSVITLCCAPDWMKGGQPGTTDWSKIEVAPQPAHYADFARLSATIAARYPDVVYFQVWNEFKGFWDARSNNWNYRAYTAFYNQVYRAVKAARPDAKVGGFYMVIEGTGSDAHGSWATQPPITSRQREALQYWLAHKAGADFICLDKKVKDYHDHSSYSRAELMSYIHYFEDVARQVHALTGLPIWWAEYYISASSADGSAAAAQAAVLASMLRGGSSVALLWEAYERVNALFDGAGKELPTTAPTRFFHQYFGPGTSIYHATTSDPMIEVLAGRPKTMLINKYGRVKTVSVNGSTYTLDPYAVQLIDTPIAADSQIHTIDDVIRGSGLDQFTYAGRGWHRCTGCGAELYDGTTAWSRTPGDTVTVRFQGRQLQLYSVRDRHHGIGAVRIDDGAETLIDFYGAPRVGDTLVWTSALLPYGPHTFRLRVTGQRRSAATDTVVPTDRVDILASP
jgi:hypothetical protein